MKLCIVHEYNIIQVIVNSLPIAMVKHVKHLYRETFTTKDSTSINDNQNRSANCHLTNMTIVTNIKKFFINKPLKNLMMSVKSMLLSIIISL